MLANTLVTKPANTFTWFVRHATSLLEHGVVRSATAHPSRGVGRLTPQHAHPCGGLASPGLCGSDRSGLAGLDVLDPQEWNAILVCLVLCV
jgi:hypothetical protein